MVYDACSKREGDLGLVRVLEVLFNQSVFNIDIKFLPIPRTYYEYNSWLENAEREHRVRPFHAVITDSNPKSTPEILVADDLTETTPLWNIRRTRRLPSKAEELASCVALFLKASSEILFVDPHFNPRSKSYQNTLQHFAIQAVGTTHPRPIELKRLEYHLRHDDTKPAWDDFKRVCEERLPILLPEGIELSLVRWEESSNAEFHWRLILTDLGAIQFDPGLDERPGGGPTTLGLLDLDDKDYTQAWNDFPHNRSPEMLATYIYEGEVKITGKRKPRSLLQKV